MPSSAVLAALTRRTWFAAVIHRRSSVIAAGRMLFSTRLFVVAATSMVIGFGFAERIATAPPPAVLPIVVVPVPVALMFVVPRTVFVPPAKPMFVVAAAAELMFAVPTTLFVPPWIVTVEVALPRRVRAVPVTFTSVAPSTVVVPVMLFVPAATPMFVRAPTVVLMFVVPVTLITGAAPPTTWRGVRAPPFAVMFRLNVFRLTKRLARNGLSVLARPPKRMRDVPPSLLKVIPCSTRPENGVRRT